MPPDGAIIPPGGFAVFYQYQFGPPDSETDVPPLFSFNSAHGDSTYLYQADPGGNLTGHRVGVSFGAAANGVFLGRYQSSVGVDFVALSQRTLGMDSPATLVQFRTGTGASNAYPLVGPVVINEIMYHPPDYGTNAPDAEEFIELLNLSGVNVPIYDPEHPLMPSNEFVRKYGRSGQFMRASLHRCGRSRPADRGPTLPVMKSKWFTWSLLLACALCILVLGLSGLWRRKPEVLQPGLESVVETDFIIDTNSVMETVLASASDTVERLRLPLALPLDRGKVTRFTTGPVLMGRPSSLRSILQYEGGYEFRHQDSIVFALKTTGAEPGEPGADVPLMPRNREAFFANVQLTRLTLKQALVRLGHTNSAFLDTDPDFQNPSLSWGWSASWKERNAPTAASVDVDPGTLLIKQYWLSVEAFGREPWPSTLTHSRSNGIRFRDPPPDCSSLEVVGVTRADAIALVRAILPEATAFCRALGPSFPSEVTEGDLDLSQCKATLMGDRIWLDLRLKSGVTVNYYRGLVYSATAPDSRDHKPEEDGLFRRSPEYTDPVTIGPEAAVAKVSRIALRRLGLPRQPLGLDAAPDVELTMTAGSTNGLRRYLISWPLPETEEERKARTWRRSGPESALSAEIDAVTGTLKRFYVRPSVLECPDPVFAKKSGLSLP